MKQIGILFQGDMVRAILEDRKTLTSRSRGLEKLNAGYYKDRINKVECRDGVWCFWEIGHGSSALPVFTAKCPYGQPGDILIGRETFKLWDYSLTQMCVEFRAGGEDFIYEFPLGKDKPKDLHRKRTDGHKPWRPSMLMPWWASRLRLKVVKVWPSRLQDMTEEMAIQEGCRETCMTGEDVFSGERILIKKTALHHYSLVWDRINGKTHPWSSNPWVWRVGLKRIKS